MFSDGQLKTCEKHNNTAKEKHFLELYIHKVGSKEL